MSTSTIVGKIRQTLRALTVDAPQEVLQDILGRLWVNTQGHPLEALTLVTPSADVLVPPTGYVLAPRCLLLSAAGTISFVTTGAVTVTTFPVLQGFFPVGCISKVTAATMVVYAGW